MENNQEMIDAMNRLSIALENFTTHFNSRYGSDPFSKFSNAVSHLVELNKDK